MLGPLLMQRWADLAPVGERTRRGGRDLLLGGSFVYCMLGQGGGVAVVGVAKQEVLANAEFRITSFRQLRTSVAKRGIPHYKFSPQLRTRSIQLLQPRRSIHLLQSH